MRPAGDLSEAVVVGRLPNGCTLYRAVSRSTNAPVYLSDECGITVEVWDVAAVDFSTLMAAIVDHLGNAYAEQVSGRARGGQ